MSPRCARDARSRDACDHDESNTVIVFCYDGTRGSHIRTRTRTHVTLYASVRASRAVRIRATVFPQLIKVLQKNGIVIVIKARYGSYCCSELSRAELSRCTKPARNEKSEKVNRSERARVRKRKREGRREKERERGTRKNTRKENKR